MSFSPAPTAARRTLLVGWDAVDGARLDSLLDAGRLPALRGLIARGHRGTVRASGPLLPTMLWATLVTGVTPQHHGVYGTLELNADGSALRPISRSARHSPSVWELLQRQNVPCVSVNFPTTHPAEAIVGTCVSDRFARPDTAAEAAASVAPADLADVLAGLRVADRQVDSATLRVIAPGLDPDGVTAAVLRRLIAESATVHAAATALVAEDDWAFAAVRYHALGPWLESFSDAAQFPGVAVAGLAFHDRMLARLIGLAGEDTLIVLVAPHGGPTNAATMARTAGELPRAALRSVEGVIVLGGPGVAADRGSFELSACDLAPTLLAAGGFGPSARMTGRVFDRVAVRTPLALSDDRPFPPRPPGGVADDPSVAYLKSIGLVETPDAHAELVRRQLAEEQGYVAALCRLDAGEPELAVRALRQLAERNPTRVDVSIALARAYAALGRVAEFAGLVETLHARHPASPVAQAGMGVAAALTGRTADARRWLASAATVGPQCPWLLTEVGRAYASIGDWGEAGVAFERASAADPRDADAWHGRSDALLRGGDAPAALDAARHAVSLRPDDNAFRLQYAKAALAAGDVAAARAAIDACLTARPDDTDALDVLARVLDSAGDPSRAAETRRITLQLRMRGPAVPWTHGRTPAARQNTR